MDKANLGKDDTWCTALVNDVKTTALLRHVGRGKFRVINDRSGGILLRGKILDASEIYHC